MSSTPTGVPIILCRQCDRYHPANRQHCATCGVASAFIRHGYCLKCRPGQTAPTHSAPADLLPGEQPLWEEAPDVVPF